MLYFKRKRIIKKLKKLSNDELFNFLRITTMLRGFDLSNDTLTVFIDILNEIRSREECRKRLIQELADLCVEGTISHVYVIVELLLYEITENEEAETIMCKILNGNLRNWINFTLYAKLHPVITERITKEDIDNIERTIVDAYRLNPR